MTWVLRDSVIDALALDDEVRDQAQAMAGESARGRTGACCSTLRAYRCAPYREPSAVHDAPCPTP